MTSADQVGRACSTTTAVHQCAHSSPMHWNETCASPVQSPCRADPHQIGICKNITFWTITPSLFPLNCKGCIGVLNSERTRMRGPWLIPTSSAGGLAAPAIAAGLGSAVGLAGAAVGVAGAGGAGASFAGMAGSAAGVLSIGGGIGIAGGNYVGAKTARRIGEVMVWPTSVPFTLIVRRRLKLW